MFPQYYRLTDGDEWMSEPREVVNQEDLNDLQRRAFEATDGNLWYVVA